MALASIAEFSDGWRLKIRAIDPWPGIRQRHDLAVELRCADGDPVEVLQSHARTADLLITSQRDPARDGGLSTGQSAGLLVGSACPLLIVPHVGRPAKGTVPGEAAPLRRALVAWADTREGARAVRDALPLLALASRVERVGFSKDARSDGSSHRGGVTRTMLGTMTGPVLMSHRARPASAPDLAS